ncbi:MOB-like protein phocein [Neolecta irregularis DAH-3]|uniref:MOB-like protein phocein n=1 Tax=Neolecta irregularis (strain DAH-3) TaxID=1198029 RepID=A0A1U7LUT9_NEOID|nr:MOB-like protein phocein [Neolecta irregularis DAH-3]|eukprot:OLL26440.1 MOB-like protein phocein [Neolecta irregularis DAH-3]
MTAMERSVPSFELKQSPPPSSEDYGSDSAPADLQSISDATEPIPSFSAAPDPSKKSVRRIRIGAKAEDMHPPKPVPLSEIESAYQLEEYLASKLEATDLHNLTRAQANELARTPEGVEQNIWIYEWIRRLSLDLNALIVALLTDPINPCTSQRCPEMRASEWQYLCAVHEQPKECCAIDYMLHTLENATSVLCSRQFPSRLSVPAGSVRHFGSIMRRLYRIFAHAYFEHQDSFWSVEHESALYKRFMAISEMCLSSIHNIFCLSPDDLIPSDLVTLPSDALETSTEKVKQENIQVLTDDHWVEGYQEGDVPDSISDPVNYVDTVMQEKELDKEKPQEGEIADEGDEEIRQ